MVPSPFPDHSVSKPNECLQNAIKNYAHIRFKEIELSSNKYTIVTCVAFQSVCEEGYSATIEVLEIAEKSFGTRSARFNFNGNVAADLFTWDKHISALAYVKSYVKFK